ncbi:hypothetical protein MXB_2104 [Myxobolus squamalis]|nr:hypothetical protein MXB_2104 [Myxobolus squamalis]
MLWIGNEELVIFCMETQICSIRMVINDCKKRILLLCSFARDYYFSKILMGVNSCHFHIKQAVFLKMKKLLKSDSEAKSCSFAKKELAIIDPNTNNNLTTQQTA